MALYPAAIIKSMNIALFSGSHSPFSGLTFWGDFLVFLEGVILGIWSSSDVVSDDDRFIVAEVRGRSTVKAYLDVGERGESVSEVDKGGVKWADETLDTVSCRLTQVRLLGQVLS
jgi:hypothetical protein